jgi:hypothetical protein
LHLFKILKVEPSLPAEREDHAPAEEHVRINMNTPIQQIREKKKDILLILSTAILLALTINCFTAYIATVTSDHPISILLIGTASLLGGILVLKRIVFARTTQIVRLRGAVAFKMNDGKFERIKILGYSFNDDFCGFLHGFLQENSAYAKLFSESEQGIVSMDTFNPDNLNRHTIINSVLEYTVLHQLDLHLNTYFVENEIDESRIVTLGRDQLGDGVLRNRVIDLITKDMKERPAFDRDSDSEHGGIVVYSHGKDGAIYQRLDVELPPKSNIARNADGFLVISNPLFDLTILPQYEGSATFIHRVFMPSLKGSDNPLNARVNLHIRIKRSAYVTGRSMEMYEWLDSFVERMHEYISTDRLERRLDPDLIKILKS